MPRDFARIRLRIGPASAVNVAIVRLSTFRTPLEAAFAAADEITASIIRAPRFGYARNNEIDSPTLSPRTNPATRMIFVDEIGA